MRVLVFSLFIFLFSLFLSPSCTSLHFLSQNQSLKDGQTLVSENRNFELGFFSPGTTKNRYVGIWYTNIQVQTVVWVANRENPLTDSSGILSVGGDGNLVILDGSGNTLWSSTISTTLKNSTAMLLDSNLILAEGASANGRERTLWQSFDHPTDTLMPKMMIGVYLETGKKRSLTSWKSEDDPAPGKFSLGLERQKVPQAFLYNESRRIWRSGQWNGQLFVGIPKMHSVYLNGFILETDRDERIMYLTHDFSSIIVRVLVDWSGMVKGLMLREDSKDWSLSWWQSISQCDVYGMCGSFGSCNPSKSPICACLIGFQPESAEEWGKGNWSVGCVRRTQLQCEKPGNYSSMMDGEGDGFLKMERVKLPDFADWLSLRDAKGCEAECLKNCSCVAYAYVSGIGCMIWVDGLIDIQEFSSGGEVLYIRLANSELGESVFLLLGIFIK
ncbi:G-type lectin S-receptor-like serine/threonine-protein kinase At1g11300 [Magnolia sinica]|uniref:G-type lectin S-receptor-like serine/threonine-protein kinase At1g11300 n=1 Tax=Magnolia sinica TaxID=86752 RepID=UPI002658517E|nr:G-type lectin S-receptor-like serine/threonine-protein kinase At1g11300 [Magnolia sinica]